MGGGTVTLLMYVLCLGSVLFVVGLATGLHLWGRREERRARAARKQGSEAPPGPRLDPPAGAG